MLKSHAVRHFGSEAAVARALNINKSSVNRWDRWVPPLSAQRLAALAGDALVFDIRKYKHWRSNGPRKRRSRVLKS